MSYSIHEVAEKLNLSTYSIRYYHDHGMLPFVERDTNNNRVFHDIDIEWLRLIICFRNTGMPLERIQHYLDLVQQGDETIPERYQMMKVQQERTVQKLAALKNHLATINHKVAHYHDVLTQGKPDTYVPTDLPQPQPTDNIA